MSVLIKGMEMPKSCADCELAEHYERYGQEHYCPFMGWYADYEKCPLIPVPPHGRLIDADELAATCDEPHWCAWLSDIDNAPTIIPAEEDTQKDGGQVTAPAGPYDLLYEEGGENLR